MPRPTVVVVSGLPGRHAGPTVAWERLPQRLAPRAAHAVGAHVHDLELWKRDWAAFERVSISAPSLVVDTTDGYSPDLAAIVEFINRG
jgi:predicted cobalt transporter CbtA